MIFCLKNVNNNIVKSFDVLIFYLQLMAIGDRGAPGLAALRLVTLELKEELETVMTPLLLGREPIV